MSNNSPIQEKMFAEIKEDALFAKASALGHDFLKRAFDRKVYPTKEALANLSIFDEDLPEASCRADEVVDLLHQFGAPAAVTHLGGRYFGFVNGSVTPAGLAAKNLSIYWDQNTAMQVISPIASKLETITQKWLVNLFRLPAETVAGFVSGTSMANFCGLAAARYRILKNQNWDINEKGLFGAPRIRVVTGKHAHATIIKAISLVGLGTHNVEWIDVDDQGRILVDQIPELDHSTILILQAGNVNSGSFDDFNAICQKARKQGAWIHIDGAFGLWAAASDSLKHLTEGIEFAHSWAVDGHKTLNTPYDSGIILCQDKNALASALHMTGGYIILGEERDGMFYTPEMSRRARVIELWATMKYLGKTGIDELITTLHERANQFAELLSEMDGFEVLNDVVFNQVIVRCATDKRTDQVIQHIQELRTCWVGGSTWEGRRVIRISVCSWATTAADVERSVRSFEEALGMVK